MADSHSTSSDNSSATFVRVVGGLITVCLLAGVGFLFYQINVNREAESLRLQEAREQVSKIAAQETPPDEWAAQKINDPWGTPLQIELVAGDIVKGTVTSAGPDKLFQTDDDISSTRHDPTAQNVGVATGRRAVKFGGGFIQGAKEALKEGKGKDKNAK